MSAPIGDDRLGSDFRQYVPKRYREQPTPEIERAPYVPSTSTIPSFTDYVRDRRTRPDHLTARGRSSRDRNWDQRTTPESPLSPLWPDSVPELPAERDEGIVAMMTRVGLVAGFAALVAFLLVFGKPLLEPVLDTVRPFLNSDWPLQPKPATKSTERVTADARTSGAVVPTAAIKSLPTGTPSPSAQLRQAPQQGQQTASISSSLGDDRSAGGAVRGVTDSEIRFGISAPFSGPAKELGQNMKLGIEAAFNLANANGGVYGRQLRLIAVDDGYEPTRTTATMKQLYERDQVFGLIGNVGTPTAIVALPYALDRKMLFFGAFTGAGLLRNDPPDRYVFNYRASYAEETAAVVNYLIKVRHLAPEQIAVFAQQDAYGDAGFAGVQKAVRALRDDITILRLNYQRNTVDVDEAVAQLQKRRGAIKAVIMVPTYRAAAKFIEKTRDLYPDMIYTSVSFVGSTALADELMLLGKKYAAGVIVTQVVPAVDGHSSLVLDYKSALAKYFPGQAPDYVSLEGYVDANVLIAALQRTGAQLNTERLVGTLENLRDFDIGLGTAINFNRSEHQGVHKVWGTQLDANGHYQPLELQ
jgi:ABC-type branched-subunit amino acid transport system substrate-binding protein